LTRFGEGVKLLPIVESELTQRQQEILKAMVRDYVEGAEPLGSDALVDKYEFDFSPATARNEMAELTRLGFLEKDHSSAGRYPTAHGFRYFIKNLMHEEDLPVVEEVAIKQRLWNSRHDTGQLLREAAASVAEHLQNLSFVITDEHKIYAAGSVHILRHPEFYDIDLTRAVLHLLDQADVLESVLAHLDPDQELGLFLGEESGLASLTACGLVACKIDLPQGHHGYLNVMGPYRLDYPNVIPTMRYVQQLVNELSRSW